MIAQKYRLTVGTKSGFGYDKEEYIVTRILGINVYKKRIRR